MKKVVAVDLSAIFERFIGEPVILEAEIPKVPGSRVFKAPLAKNPTIAEMEKLAAAEGLQIVVRTPETPGRTEFRDNRVNVTVMQNKNNGNRWEITSVTNDSGQTKTLVAKNVPSKQKAEVREPEQPVTGQKIHVMKKLRLKGNPKP